MIVSLIFSVFVLFPQGPSRGQDAEQAIHPLAKDRTGIKWVYPFRKALAKAKKEKRLLLILPLAGGSDRAGNW